MRKMLEIVFPIISKKCKNNKNLLNFRIVTLYLGLSSVRFLITIISTILCVYCTQNIAKCIKITIIMIVKPIIIPDIRCIIIINYYQ